MEFIEKLNEKKKAEKQQSLMELNTAANDEKREFSFKILVQTIGGTPETYKSLKPFYFIKKEKQQEFPDVAVSF